jgi:hypothetical protein
MRMKHIYLATTLVLLAVSGILGLIGVRPAQHASVTKTSADTGRFVAQASRADQKL